jgi:CHAD domain-containing protein
MAQAIQFTELFRKTRAETPHILHVTALALRLFDGMRERCRFPRKDRKLLEIAALLHDVGYTTDHRTHAEHSARIALEHPAVDLSAKERHRVALVIRTHGALPKNWEKYPLKDKKLGMLLRLADGLDHSHIQDAEIKDIKFFRNRLLVNIISGWYPHAVQWASGKTVMWKDIFPFGPELRDVTPRRYKGPYSGVIRKDDELVNGARKILYSQFRIIIDTREGAITGNNPENMHDFRVALRRFRTGLKLFGAHIKPRAGIFLKKGLADLSREIGPARDMDVWVGFLESGPIRKLKTKSEALQAFSMREKERSIKIKSILGIALKSTDFWGLIGCMAHTLRSDLPVIAFNKSFGPLRNYLAGQLQNMLKNLLKKTNNLKSNTPEQMHNVRKICRKARYTAEMTAPMLGEWGIRLVNELKTLTGLLGSLHDLDMGLEHIARHVAAVPHVVERHLISERKKRLFEFKRKWREFAEPEHQRKLLEKLQRVENPQKE